MTKLEFVTRIQVNGVKEEVSGAKEKEVVLKSTEKGLQTMRHVRKAAGSGRQGGASMRKIWIIRFSDGTIGSCYGTRSGATEIAELRKEDYGGSYTIEGGENDGERA